MTDMEGMEGRNLFKKEREKHPDQKKEWLCPIPKTSREFIHYCHNCGMF
jgi:uncharacterized short protein YbdD (DUF466 family)